MHQDSRRPGTQQRPSKLVAARATGHGMKRVTLEFGPEELAVARAFEGLVENAETLRSQERVCLLLRYQGGFSAEQIAGLFRPMSAFGRTCWTAPEVARLIESGCQRLASFSPEER